MLVEEALNAIAGRLALLNDRQLMATGSTLQQADLTWQDWCDEIAVRLSYLRQGPSQDVLDAIGALVVAHKMKLAEAEETRVDSGAEAA